MSDPTAALYRRLEIGWQLIDQEHDPRRRWRLEEHWLRLLREYERICDRWARERRAAA